MTKNLRAYTEGAIVSAIFLVFLLLANYTPIGAFLFFLLPLPFSVYATRHSLRHHIVVGIFSLILTALFGFVLLFPLVLYAWLVGLVLGYSFAKRHPALHTVVLGSLAVLGFTLLSLLFSAFVLNINVIQEIEELLKTVIGQNQALYQNLFPGAANEEMVDLLVDQLMEMMTSILVISSFITGLINYWAAYVLNKRLGFAPAPFPRLSQIKFPASLLFYYIGGIILRLIPPLMEIKWIYLAVMNILPVLEIAIALQGLFFLFYFAEKRKMGKALPVIGCILLFIPPFPFILSFIGILDLGFNIRQKIASRG